MMLSGAPLLGPYPATSARQQRQTWLSDSAAAALVMLLRLMVEITQL